MENYSEFPGEKEILLNDGIGMILENVDQNHIITEGKFKDR